MAATRERARPETAPPPELRSPWVRRRYYIEDGFIKPVPGSTVESYNPLASRLSGGSPGEAGLLHVELAALDAEDPKAVEQFVSAWGLLGLYQNRQRATVDHYQALGGAEDGMLPSYCIDYLPGLRSEPEPHRRNRGARLNKLQQALQTAALWDYLAEPLPEFQQAAEEFRRAYRLAVGVSEGRLGVEDGNRLKKVLEEHLLRVRPVPAFTTDARGDRRHNPGESRVTGWALDWELPSLLSAAYMLLFLDLTEGRRPRLCANERCGRPFLTDRSDRFYCSARCSDNQKQREIRRREKGQGQPEGPDGAGAEGPFAA